MELIRSKDLKKDLIYNNIYNYLLINENHIYHLFFLITRYKSLKMINQKWIYYEKYFWSSPRTHQLIRKQTAARTQVKRRDLAGY